MRRAEAIYGTLLHCYPAPFRHEYGRQMRLLFAEQLEQARRTGAWRAEAALWAQAAWDLLTIAPREHGHVIRQDLRLAFRTMAARPAFASVAVLSLALGIGANTAIFSLWNGALHTPLPKVEDPEGLVMLTRPTATGSWRGRVDGVRSWVSFAEFEELRDNTPGFSALMASESRLNTWRMRVEGGPPEEVRGRLVSGGFFEVLGVRPAIGRLFSAAEDEGEPPYAVISHAYWQRRFGGRSDVLGRPLTLRNSSVAVIGVAPSGFVGETSGQQPDLWLPVRLQPRVLPGGDWLHDSPPDKVMWLHVFGRLRPGVTEAQAEAQANAVLQANLEAFYGATGEQRPEFLDQHLRLRPAARGASGTSDQFSTSLTLLLASVGILLLITCANLANLLLARGAARQAEIAVRVSLGASRARLIRQLLTEAVALAALGGLAAIAVAYVLHGALVRMLREAEPRFFMSFGFDVPMLAFALGATLAAALLFGALPAWQMTRTDAGAYLKDHSRGAGGSARELRWGRWLVGLQLTLSLPLLVGAGLLVRTLYNVQRPDLGFPTQRLVLARVDLSEVASDVRRDRVLREIRARILAVPGVAVASFSQIGVLSGGESTATIEVEGATLTDSRELESSLDRVGADYFKTTGIPLRSGRDIDERDGADTPKVCTVNEAFVQRFFGGRPPIGRHVTTVEDDGVRATYEVVGVVGNARIRGLRDDIEPRFFVPAEQRPSRGESRTFLVRTRPEAAAVKAALREAIVGVDPALSVSDVVSIEEKIAYFIAEERAIARLAVVFGTVALALAAIGLYGVLSYGVVRRSGEIGIRMALGARPRDVITMILRESLGLVVAGLALGGAVAWLGAAMIASRLYGVAPQDPLTLASATAVLLVVALLAAYLPARRASRVDPMAALHQG